MFIVNDDGSSSSRPEASHMPHCGCKGTHELDMVRFVCTVRCLVHVMTLQKTMKAPCGSPTKMKVPPKCSTLSRINVFMKTVSRARPTDTSHTIVISDQSRQSPMCMFCRDMYRRAFTFTDRVAFMAVAIYHAVFEDVICPHLNALRSKRNGVKSKTSLRESCCHIQREASRPDNPRRCHQPRNVTRPSCCPD